jgi:hypothetical protein
MFPLLAKRGIKGIPHFENGELILTPFRKGGHGRILN